jgi:hypothetical protein
MTTPLHRFALTLAPARLVVRPIAGLISIRIAIMAIHSEVRPR